METTYIYNILIERGYDPHSARLVSAELIHLSQPLSGDLDKKYIRRGGFGNK